MTAYGVDEAYVTAHGTGRKVVRTLLYIVALIIGLNVAASLIDQWVDPQTDGPFGSTFVTTGHGAGAWHDVLVELGRDVERTRRPFGSVAAGSADVVVVVDPDSSILDLAYARSLTSHAEEGGSVVLVGVANASRLFDLDLNLQTGRPGELVVAGADPLLESVSRLEVSDERRMVGGEALAGDDDGAVVSRYRRGSGELIVVSDARMFTNDWIDEADNAVLAVRLAGEGAVVFDEYVHGFGLDQGWQGLGATLRRVGIVGLVAALIAMWAVGARLGPPEQTERALPPPRAAYLDSLAISISASRDTSAFNRLKDRASRKVGRIAGRYIGLSESEQRRKAAAQLGLDDDELAVLNSAEIGDVEELAAVAAKIERATERTGQWTN